MKPNYFNGISIIIPTYNREKQLCRLLDSIFKEDISDLYEIVVVDNSSDYDTHEVLSKYSSQKIRVVRNSFNIKMATNMVNTFLHCKTKWMWLISDDDVICENSIKKISNTLPKNSNAAYLKFSTKGTGANGIEKNREVEGLEKFIDYYLEDKNVRRGNLVFVSNGVFNLEILHPHLGYAFEFSYTYIGYLTPVFFALNSGSSILFSNEEIIKYLSPENENWSFATVGLGLSTLSHLPLKLDQDYFKKFLNITMAVTFEKLFKYLLFNKVNMPRQTYKRIYLNSYMFYLTPIEKILSKFCYLLLSFPRIGRVLYPYLLRIINILK